MNCAFMFLCHLSMFRSATGKVDVLIAETVLSMFCNVFETLNIYFFCGARSVHLGFVALHTSVVIQIGNEVVAKQCHVFQ